MRWPSPSRWAPSALAAREELDNLTFVINCNLQQLDGPVRGNGKIIQELEAYFRGAGWNVIKVIWGREWDALLARDVDGVLVNQMNTTPDGQFQTYSVEDGGYIREHFFGADPRLRKMVEHMTDDQIEKLPRGGHDYRKVYAAFDAASEHVGQPTVILAQDHQGLDDRRPRGQERHPPDEEADQGRPQEVPRPALPADQRQGPRRLLRAHRWRRSSTRARTPPRSSTCWSAAAQLGGSLPQAGRARQAAQAARRRALRRAQAGLGQEQDRHHDGGRPAAARLDEGPGDRPPHRADRARRVPHVRHGLDVPDAKVYNPGGQQYESVDRKLLLAYKESAQGQLLHEGISEAGAMASATAAGSTYSTHGEHMIPFYIFYSMFGFQRTGDSIWAMADQLARGFLIGATAGRTTLTGEGLQHADGHSPLLAATNPAVVHYDPAFAYEVSHVMQDGLRRMYGSSDEHPHGEDVIFYITVYNEPIDQPAEPGRRRRGGHAARASTTSPSPRGVRQRRRRTSSCSRPASAFPWIPRRSSCSPRTGAWPPTCGRSPRGTSSPATLSRPRSGP